ncbi:hypothetical protein Trydic_g23183 [Trypoxylus dichotomus]
MTPKYQDADSQYSKDPRIRKEDVQILMEWMAKQPHLPKIDEYKVILFFQSCYYRIESAKATIENYYTVRANCPEFFANRSIADVEKPMKSSVAYLLPELSVQGYSVMFAKLIDTNPDHFDCNNLIKYFDMAVSLILRQIGTSEGHVLVVDMEGTSFGHVAKVNVNSARKYVHFLQEAMPVRVKEIHLLNVSAISQTLVNLVKPFLRNDIVEMLHTHASIDTLFDYVPKKAFPKEYGGEGGTIQEIMEKQKQEFEENAEYFQKEEMEIVNESKRIGQAKKAKETFAMSAFDNIKDNNSNKGQLKQEDVKLLQEWLEKQSHLPKISESKLKIFLHICVYNTESAKKFIENFYVIRARWPEFSKGRNILSADFQMHLQTSLTTRLPIETKEGYAILYARLMDTNPDHCDFLRQLKIFDMSAMVCLKTSEFQGTIAIADLNGVSLSHLLKVNLAEAAKFTYYAQKAHNRAMKAVHILSTTQMLHKFFALIKPFATKKMLDKLHLHQSLDSLHEHVPKEFLPNELGGQVGTLKELHEKHIKLLRDNADFLEELEEDKADLSKKTEKRQDLDNISGIDGSFRKLDID